MDLEALLANPVADREQAYAANDAILYALALGYGSNPVDPSQLAYTYEKNLNVVPTFACVLATPGFWYQNPVYKVDWIKLLHAAQSIELIKPLPPSGTVRATYKVVGVEDRGDRGAFVTQEKSLFDAQSGELLARLRSVAALRGDGHCGDFGDRVPKAAVIPEAKPEFMDEYSILPQAALLYRLNGDANPIHADPALAAKAGFRQPILHGLCTFGMACRWLLATFCANEPSRLKGMSVRFTQPVYPGETLRFEGWQIGEGQIAFRAIVAGRDVAALSGCEASFEA